MLPAALQLPAAVVLVVSGVLACFAGYRLFRIVLAIYGFILGAAIASSVMGPGEGTAMIVGAVVGGLAGALLLHGFWARFGTGDAHVGLVVVCAVLGAVIATNLQRWVIILATASGGAWTLIVGGSALMGDRAAKVAAATKDVWVFYPMNLEPGRRWLLGVWLLIAIAGVIVQARGKAKPRTTRVKKQKR